MLHYNTIAPHTLELVKGLFTYPEFASCRLVGGTALALQYGHRTSVDLDVFGMFDGDRTLLTQLLGELGSVSLVHSNRFMSVYDLDQVKLDVVNYTIPWIDEPIVEEGLVLASPKDIAAMKVNAIIGRGSRKDFIDLYFLLQHYSLNQILGYFCQKYPDVDNFIVLRSIMYFEDADRQKMPQMFDDTDWQTMKDYIVEQAIALL